MFGNKWNDIASYLPMRCNNDIKNHFNLYLKDKQSSVSLENSYLRAGYDLPSLLAAEPEDVATRRERLEKERVSFSSQHQLPASVDACTTSVQAQYAHYADSCLVFDRPCVSLFSSCLCH
jgi:hypothetical protein